MPKLSAEQVNAANEQGYESDGEAPERKPLPCGANEAYVYRLVECEAGLSKSSQKPQWVWTLQLSKKHHPEYVGHGYLERLWVYTSTAAGEEWRVGKMLNQFGYSADSETDELIEDGATILVYVYEDEYNGKVSMKARRCARHDEEQYPEVAEDDDF